MGAINSMMKKSVSNTEENVNKSDAPAQQEGIRRKLSSDELSDSFLSHKIKIGGKEEKGLVGPSKEYLSEDKSILMDELKKPSEDVFGDYSSPYFGYKEQLVHKASKKSGQDMWFESEQMKAKKVADSDFLLQGMPPKPQKFDLESALSKVEKHMSLFLSQTMIIKPDPSVTSEHNLSNQPGFLDYMTEEVAVDNLEVRPVESKELKPKSAKPKDPVQEVQADVGEVQPSGSFKNVSPGVARDDPRRVFDLRTLQTWAYSPKNPAGHEKDEEDDEELEEHVGMSVLVVYMECKEEGKQFTDIEFPPDQSSVVGASIGGLTLDELGRLKNLVWKRPSELASNSKRSLCSEISVKQINQGMIGDCYLLVGLACLAQKPSRIHKLLHVRRANKVGVYAVNLCIHSIWETILLDDMLPCKSENKLAFTSNSNASADKYQLWPMMIEKAWAKVHGGYSNINEGLIDEALHDLTGAPTSYVFIKDHTADIHWTIISEAIEKGYMVACGTRDFNSSNYSQIEESSGLVHGHAYSILGYFEIIDDSGELIVAKNPEHKGIPGNQRILKLFNPWSRRGQYKGDWCDSYKGWTARLRKELQQTESTNSKGIFYISLESFIKYFYSYVVCYYEDDFQYSSEKFESSPTEPTVLSFELPKAGDYYITVSQMNSRMFRESDNYSYSTVAMVIARAKSDGSYDYKCSTNKTDKDVWLKVECRKPGKYVCCILTPWQSISNTFGFSIYGPEQISEIVQRDTSAGEKLLGQLMMVRAAKKTAESKNFAEYGHPDIGFAVQHASNGLGYIFLDNNSADTQLTANIFIKESKNTIFYPVAKKNRFEVVLGPKRQKIIVYQMCGQAAQLRFQERFHFVSDFKKNSQFVRTKGTRIPRLLADGSDVGVSLYTLKKDDVQILFFENHSDQHFYSETVHLTLQNAKIAASDATSLVVDLKPRRCRYVVVRKADKHAKPFSVEVAKSEAAVFVPKDT